MMKEETYYKDYVCVCVYMCVYVCMFVCVCVRACARVRTPVCVSKCFFFFFLSRKERDENEQRSKT